MTRYSWDPDKQARNLHEHGSDCADVPGVFDGPTLEFQDDAHSLREVRVRAVGLLYGIEVAVICTDDDVVGVRPLISARKATPRERRAFYREAGGQ